MLETKSYDVFLSYSSGDREWVEEFVNSLRASGLTTWFDAADIPPGEHWQEYVEKALRESSTLVVIVSPGSVSSPWRLFELGAAVADGKRIVPVLTQDIDLHDIPSPLTRLQFLREPSPQLAGKRVAEIVALARHSDAARAGVSESG